MKKQVITIKKNGGIETLLISDMIDLRMIGSTEAMRATEILLDVSTQKWYVKILLGKYENRALSTEMWNVEVVGLKLNKIASTLYYDTYEQARDAEIQFLNSLRERYGQL